MKIIKLPLEIVIYRRLANLNEYLQNYCILYIETVYKSKTSQCSFSFPLFTPRVRVTAQVVQESS